MLFRYYKGPKKQERWKVIAVEHENTRLSSDDVAFATILAVSERVKSGESVSEEAKYQGPFYIDIDNDENVNKSIKTAKKVVQRLLGNGVPATAISVWASGKKGFHITIPMACFTDERPVKKLPLAYRQMAIALGLFETDNVDTTVYSTGKGRMWRLANKQRDDNNKYKVPVSVAELEDMTADVYNELVSQPRTLPELGRGASRVPFLEGLFKLSLGRAEQMEKPKGVFIDPNLKKALKEQLPPCVEDLRHFRNIRDGKGFNETSLQFAKGVASFCPDDAKELIDDFANNSHGNTYNTPSKRMQHCRTAFRIAAKNSGYDWSCKSILSVLKDEPCFNCPIAFIRNEEEEDAAEGQPEGSAPAQAPKRDKAKSAKAKEVKTVKLSHNDGGYGGLDPNDIPLDGLVYEDDEPAQSGTDGNGDADAADSDESSAADDSAGGSEPPSGNSGDGEAGDDDESRDGFNMEGLMETDDGYGFMDGSGKFRRVSNFLLKLKKVYVEFIANVERDVRVAVQGDVVIGGRSVGQVFLEENNWNSKSSFISAFGGLANAAFYGKDDDVQKMKSALMLDIEKTSMMIRRVYSCGIHRQQIGEKWVFTYVEPGWSIDQYGNENLYTLSGKLVAHPRIKAAKDLEVGDDKVGEVIRAMFQVNHPYRVAQVLGWTMASFLKQHIFTFRNEFPLLSLHGEPGSGKTSTAALFAALHGVDYRMESSPVNLPSSTGFSAWTFVASTTTVPRLMEEFNKSKMPKTYDMYAENFKACWNQHAVQRGTIRGDKLHGASQIGAHVVQIPLTGPVAICSEQEVTMVALVERMIQVRFSKQDKEKAEFEQPFNFAAARLDRLKPFARAAYLETLQIAPEELQHWLEEISELVPSEITARPRYSYQVVLLGLRFLERLLRKYEIAATVELGQLREQFIEWLTHNRTEIATTKRTSEVDAIINKWNTMAAMSSSEGQLPWLMKGQHYLRRGDTLYVDHIVAHAQYIRFVGTMERGNPVIDNMREFLNLIRGEAYCLSTNEIIDGFAKGRPVLALSCGKMASKGIIVSGFEDSGA